MVTTSGRRLLVIKIKVVSLMLVVTSSANGLANSRLLTLPSSKAPFLNCYHDVYKVLWYAVLVCCEGSLVLEISILRDPSFWKFLF